MKVSVYGSKDVVLETFLFHTIADQLWPGQRAPQPSHERPRDVCRPRNTLTEYIRMHLLVYSVWALLYFVILLFWSVYVDKFRPIRRSDD
ncbi:hypothetical protein BDW22DRAFT_693095 [Trametopsis cervina]|nr:hypothetical protein BDW22DRAFT_693095 [Trametopsis cervina]